MTGLLLSAEADGRRLSFTTLEEAGSAADVTARLVELAETPLAPLASQVLVDGLQTQRLTESSAMEFAMALGRNVSVLAVLDSADVILSADVSVVIAPALPDAMLTDIVGTTESAPSLAASRLDVAIRAVALGARPYRLMDVLTSNFPGAGPEFVERLPGLLGLAMDAFGITSPGWEPLHDQLGQLLRTQPTADVRFELGAAALAQAVNSASIDEVIHRLDVAHDHFQCAQELDSERDDAAVYALTTAATRDFLKGQAHDLDSQIALIETYVERRAAWHRGMHAPTWRRSAPTAEAAWMGLLLDLRYVHDATTQPSWLDAFATVARLADIHQAERSIWPGATFATTVKPEMLSNLARRATLVDQFRRAVAADRALPEPGLPAAVDDIIAALAATRSDDAYDTDTTLARIEGIAPGLRQALGDEIALAVGHLDDQTLIQTSDLLAVIAVSPSQNPAMQHLLVKLRADLETNPSFEGAARTAVIALLEPTLAFLFDRYERGGVLKPGLTEYISPRKADEAQPRESALQMDFYIWLASSRHFTSAVRLETPGIATGRVDVTVTFPSGVRINTEIKRELQDASPAQIESNYLAQAAAYSGANVPFSQLLVLDLTDHQAGVPHMEDLVWVARRPEVATTVQQVVVGIVVGNRPTPSALKST